MGPGSPAACLAADDRVGDGAVGVVLFQQIAYRLFIAIPISHMCMIAAVVASLRDISPVQSQKSA